LQDIRQKLLATFQVEHRDHVEQMRSLLALIASTGAQPAEAQLEEVYRRAHTLKGAARVVELRSVEGLAHRLETLFTQVRQGALTLDKNAMNVVLRGLDAMDDCVAGLGAGRAVLTLAPALHDIERLLGIDSPPPVPAAGGQAELPAFQPLDTMRVSVTNFDGLLRSAVELISESQAPGQLAAQLDAIASQTARLGKEAETALRVAARMPRTAEETREGAAIRSVLSSLEQQMRSVSAQTLSARRLYQRRISTITRLGKQLQRDVLRARLTPAEGLLEGCRKMVRDLARDEVKQINFVAVSTCENADRRVLEALKDPLMHALRNAISHGIELPQEREAKGKPAEGLVSLRIEGDGQRLKILIEDDGRGVDRARVIELAVQRKIISEAEAERCSPRDLGRILFSAGFSTASSITNLAGRGMGLSVVYEAVRRLQGEVEMEPRPGGGTSLRLAVPVSISTYTLLLVSCGGQPFAIPFYSIERLHRIRPGDVGAEEGRPVITFGGQRVPLFALQHLLNLPSLPPAQGVKAIPVVILRSQSERTAVTVDSFLGQMEAVIHDLGVAAPNHGKITGGVLMENGSIALVLNPAGLLDISNRAEQPPISSKVESAPTRRAFSILVVDDSITTRTLEKSILETHGYQVRTAVDGLEALAQLRAARADLVISDVEMPRMDGFELLEAMKKDRELDKIPVIVVTSLERREDRERGLSLGADAYIVKRKFDQGELLAAIRQIL
jgi:two-component system, chemotaxis family, sensor kinase CheA